MRRRNLLVIALAIFTGWLFLASYQSAEATGTLTLWETGWGVMPFLFLSFMIYWWRKR